MTEAQILDLLQQPHQQERAFRSLVELYSDALHRHIYRMLGNATDAQDVLQNVLLKAWRGLGQFRGNSKLYTWLYRIATNESLAWLDKQRRQRTDSTDALLNVGEQLAADTYFDGDEAQRLLLRAIGELPNKQRAIFQLRYFDEMSYRDMSAVFGTSEGGLKASYHHASRKVEHYLRQHAMGLNNE